MFVNREQRSALTAFNGEIALLSAGASAYERVERRKIVALSQPANLAEVTRAPRRHELPADLPEVEGPCAALLGFQFPARVPPRYLRARCASSLSSRMRRYSGGRTDSSKTWHLTNVTSLNPLGGESSPETMKCSECPRRFTPSQSPQRGIVS